MTAPLYRLYTILNSEAVKDMKGNRGRMVTQGAHGYLHAFWDAEARFPEDARAYRTQASAFKITLVAGSEAELRAIAERYRDLCGVAVTEEKGTRTDGTVNVEVRGVTGIGIGPLRDDLVGEDIRALRPFL